MERWAYGHGLGRPLPLLNEVREGSRGASGQSKENSMCKGPEV